MLRQEAPPEKHLFSGQALRESPQELPGQAQLAPWLGLSSRPRPVRKNTDLLEANREPGTHKEIVRFIVEAEADANIKLEIIGQGPGEPSIEVLLGAGGIAAPPMVRHV